MNVDRIKVGDRCSIITGVCKGQRAYFLKQPQNNSRISAIITVEDGSTHMKRMASLVFDTDLRPNQSNKRKKKEEDNAEREKEQQEQEQEQANDIDPPPSAAKDDDVNNLTVQMVKVCNFLQEFLDRLTKIENERL